MAAMTLFGRHNSMMESQQCSVHILCDSLEGGLGQAALSEANYLSSIGWRVMLSAPEVPESVQLKTRTNFTRISVPMAIRNLNGMLHSSYVFRKNFKGIFAPRLIHAHGLRSFVVARTAFPLTPLVVTFHGAPPSGRLRRTFFRIVSKVSTGAVSVAPINMSGWKHWWHWSPAVDFNLVHGLTDLSKSSAGVSAIDEMAAPTAQLVLGWLGRFDLPKRPDIWLITLARAREQGIDIRGVMAGDGPLLDQTQKDVLNRDLDVEFLGWQTAEAALSQMDVLLTWSDSEGVPFVMQEAIAAGIPCLTNDLPGPASFLGARSLGVVTENSVVKVLGLLADSKERMGLHLEQSERLKLLLAEGRPEEKFASLYQHRVAGGH